ncbi:unnamed protein product [Arctia plantaginis]|uniref:Uncharacterized protein n=1 Tax=Arctia plantaginis TaxID=874455 RepID=A0A8S1BEW6_ARCPL|nr:unnamed protein product [Arctia plantaginis]
MLILILFAFLVTNISAIKCIETFEEINVEIDFKEICHVNKTHKLPAGTGVVVKVKNKRTNKITTAIVEKEDQTKSENFSFNMFNLTAFKPLYIPNDNFNKTYKLFFKFIYESDQHQQNNLKGYNRPMCNTSVLYESVPNTAAVSQDNDKEHWHTYVAIAGVLVGIVIIALLATTMYYKRQAKMLSQHISLERRAERADESDRYCSNPRKGKKVSPILNNNRVSDIYEDPQINFGVSPMPPALPTTPRPNKNEVSTLKKLPSPSITLKSNASQMSLTRPRVPDKETQVKLTMARRPPLPLPQDEFYSAAPEDDTYEEPPVPERPNKTTPTKKPGQQETIGTIPKKITKPANIVKPRPEKVGKALEKKLGKTFPNIPMDGLKPPGIKQPHKPAVPSGKPTPPRNNVVQVPICQIPDPSSLKKAPLVKPKPNNVKPTTPPSPTLEQVQFINDERRDSTDDEYWTYEPLPQYHIYNN